MRVAILGINHAPEEIGIARYTTGLARALAARGHAVNVICGQPYYPAWKVSPGHPAGRWTHTVEQGVSITRCPHYVPANPTGARRILHLFSFALSALGPCLRMALGPRSKRPEVIVCIVPALFSMAMAWLAARLCGARLWVHVQDFEVEAAFATGLVASHGLAARLAFGVERELLGLADTASSISPQMCAKLVDKGIAREAVVEIRNWADGGTVFTATQDTPLRAEWKLGTRKVCLYSGNIANKQGIEILIEAARLLAARDDIAFVICGQGPNRANLERLAQGLDNVQFHDLQPMERMGDLLSLASLHLLPQIPGAADLVLPSKLTNMLASGRPVVATALPGTGLYDEVDGCGINTPPGDAQALARAIVALVDDPEMAARMGEAAAQRAVERWSMERIIDRFDDRLTLLRAPVQEKRHG